MKMKPAKLYIWLFMLTIIVALILGFMVYDFIIGETEYTTIDLKEDSIYLTLLIALAGILAGFSVISMYSVFNANMDWEKQRIYDTVKEVEHIKTDLLEKIEKLDERIKREKNELDSFGNQLNEFTGCIYLVNNLTSPYSATLKKISAIIDFKEKEKDKVNDSFKEIVHNYFNTLSRKDEIYDELRDLLIHWEKVPPGDTQSVKMPARKKRGFFTRIFGTVNT